ncbi:MAG: TIGR03905 family TSCPD domain-containing protein [Clostridiaceae bacterium]|mgnify:CR=1 FL=1|nr:TIGR03905 family TSCPD domain-containing protein [Clostridiaceae bacterium]
MTIKHKNKGTCSSLVEFEIVSGKIHNVKFTGGCNGNLSGISALVEGMDAREAAQKLKGIKCGFKSTSCPDQLSNAIEKALTGEIENL